MKNSLPLLPPNKDLETKRVLKQLARTYRYLSELKGYADTIPNKHMLINAVTIKEAKDSSEIENIVTTHDEIYKAISSKSYNNPSAKEVVNYREALWHGYEEIKKNSVITTNLLIEIQRIIERNESGIRKLPGTVLLNENSGDTIYTPPFGEDVIRNYLHNLEIYMNDSDHVDPLIKLAVIHYQFESIHPFYDGNGRTGRILNVLYLVKNELLDSPILYLSGYIIRNKDLYYSLLQKLHNDNQWEEWILYILTGIEETAEEALLLSKKINNEIEIMSAEVKEKLPKIYSKELMDLLFYEFYTKTNYIEAGLGVTRKTAAGYLSELEKNGFLVSERIGRERIYKNNRLFKIISGS
ncbi:MAG: Fic family protein [Anaerolineaceae bacterium]|nr:MAG: Fic family protein [Anaerolineaceae bacterium]